MLLSCIHKNEYCSSGAGGELNCIELVTVDRNRSRLWMRRVRLAVGLWILRGPNRIGLGNWALNWALMVNWALVNGIGLCQ